MPRESTAAPVKGSVLSRAYRAPSCVRNRAAWAPPGSRTATPRSGWSRWEGQAGTQAGAAVREGAGAVVGAVMVNLRSAGQVRDAAAGMPRWTGAVGTGWSRTVVKEMVGSGAWGALLKETNRASLSGSSR